MSNKLYVGNLPYSVDKQTLTDLFAEWGTVESVNVITDRDTGRSKGFAFVEMSTSSEAQAAIKELGGKDCEGRPMTVNEARPQRKKFEGGPRGSGHQQGRREGGGRHGGKPRW